MYQSEIKESKQSNNWEISVAITTLRKVENYTVKIMEKNEKNIFKNLSYKARSLKSSSTISSV